MTEFRQHRRHRVSGIAVVLSFFLAACTSGANLPLLPQPNYQIYHIGVGDKIRVGVFGQEPLSGQFLVSAAGDVALPLLGSVRVVGETPKEFTRQLTDQYKKFGILTEPNVTIEVEEYRPIFVLGEVAKPGQYPFQPGMTMLTAVAVAGGFTYRAVKTYAQDVRSDSNTAVIGKIEPQSFLQPGDIVTIYERMF